MSALVGYGSSDEEDEIKPEKAAKVAKLQESAPSILTQSLDAPVAHPEAHIETQRLKASSVRPSPAQSATQSVGPTPSPANMPAQGPAVPDLDQPMASVPGPSSEAPLSPYTFTSQRRRELTMPPVPNFDIPDSPSPPPTNSEEAAALAGVTKQFERFLELKKQGVHFNARLQNSNSLRNPSLLPKLMDFAGISKEESHAFALPDELTVPARWPEDCYVESLLKQNEKKEKKRLAEREKVDFVPAAQAAEAGASSARGEGSIRKSKFDRR